MMALGSSIEDQAKAGQDVRFIDYYLLPYSEHFEQGYLFSYGQKQQVIAPNIKVLPNRSGLHRMFYAITMVFQYRKQLQACDVLRVMQMTGALPAALATLLYKKPYVATFGYCYSDLARLNGLKLTAAFLSILEWIGLRYAARVIVTSPVVYDYLVEKRHTPKEKIVMIPNGVDIERFTPQKPATSKSVEILSIGRLEQEKNYGALIEAIAALENSDLHLTLIGKGRQQEALIALAKEKTVSLSVIPPMPYDKLTTAYQAADIFVLPSFSEGQPKVLLEAMACGLPCIVTPCAGMKAIITDSETGWVTKGFSASDIADTLGSLLSETKRAHEVGQRARHEIVKTYNLKRNVDKEIDVLKTVGQRE